MLRRTANLWHFGRRHGWRALGRHTGHRVVDRLFAPQPVPAPQASAAGAAPAVAGPKAGPELRFFRVPAVGPQRITVLTESLDALDLLGGAGLPLLLGVLLSNREHAVLRVLTRAPHPAVHNLDSLLSLAGCEPTGDVQIRSLDPREVELEFDCRDGEAVFATSRPLAMAAQTAAAGIPGCRVSSLLVGDESGLDGAAWPGDGLTLLRGGNAPMHDGSKQAPPSALDSVLVLGGDVALSGVARQALEQVARDTEMPAIDWFCGGADPSSSSTALRIHQHANPDLGELCAALGGCRLALVLERPGGSGQLALEAVAAGARVVCTPCRGLRARAPLAGLTVADATPHALAAAVFSALHGAAPAGAGPADARPTGLRALRAAADTLAARATCSS